MSTNIPTIERIRSSLIGRSSGNPARSFHSIRKPENIAILQNFAIKSNIRVLSNRISGDSKPKNMQAASPRCVGTRFIAPSAESHLPFHITSTHIASLAGRGSLDKPFSTHSLSLRDNLHDEISVLCAPLGAKYG